MPHTAYDTDALRAALESAARAIQSALTDLDAAERGTGDRVSGFDAQSVPLGPRPVSNAADVAAAVAAEQESAEIAPAGTAAQAQKRAESDDDTSGKASKK